MTVIDDAQVVDPSTIDEAPGYRLSHVEVTGDVRSRFDQPLGFDQWIVMATLAKGSTITWGNSHGDESVYVVEGELRIGSGVARAGAAVIVESDTAAELEALSDSRIIHMGSEVGALDPTRPLGLPDAKGRGVHLIEPTGIEGLNGDGSTKSKVAFFANGKCPSCRLMLYKIESAGDTRSHFHTQPQLQHVLKGTIRVGPFTVSEGMTFCVPAGYRYGYRADGPWDLLVYRPDLSRMKYRAEEELMDEGGDFDKAPPWAS